MMFRLCLISTALAAFTTANSFASVSPEVTAVSVPASGPYGKNKPMEFTVSFTENVFVLGFPILTLQIGSETRNALFHAGGGTTGLVFRYVVQTGDTDADGIAITGLSLNGGSIKSSSNLDADLTLNSVASTSAITVETVAPQVTSVKRKSPASQTTSSSSVTFEVEFSEDVQNVTTSYFQITSVNGGTVSATVASVSGGPKIYDVGVNITSGAGEFRLDLIK